MAHSVEDVALLLGVMVGGKASVARWSKAARLTTRHLRIGVSEYHMRNMDSRVAKVVQAAIRDLGPLVKSVRTVHIAELEGVQEASTIIGSSEAVAFHDQHLREQPHAYGPIVRARLEGGYAHTAIAYVQALQKQRSAQVAFAGVFEEIDLLVGASLPVVAPRIDAAQVTINGTDANTVDALTRFNAPQNVAGLPALSVPCGFVGGLPVGLQIFGPQGHDAQVLSLGAAFQRATDWHLRGPKLR